ncbi:hypothetical protein ACTQ4E_01005 [Lawsonibacter sp. LCP25S3_G6]|uniref:hypothetical protein n=1 Tax=unclassified Lawsonibacter TaxID=2617946 RepID=UPI003F975357
MRRTRPKNTEPAKRRERKEAIRGVVTHVVVQLLSVAVLLGLRCLTVRAWLDNLLLFVAVLDLITLPFSFIVLRQRLREIEKGEMEEARKY